MPLDTHFALVLGIAVFAVLLISFLAGTTASVLIREYEAGVRLRRGRVAQNLRTGRTRYWRRGTEITTVDLRERLTCVPLQEVLTAEGVAIKISLSLHWRVEDPVRFVVASESPEAALYDAAQLALREALAAVSFDHLMEHRGEVEAAMAAPLAESASRLGIHMDRAAVKDQVLGGELKRAMADVVKARTEVRSRLERARGETAVLRGLVNSSRLIEEHKGLYRLCLLDTARSVAEGAGNSLILGGPRDVELAGGRGE